MTTYLQHHGIKGQKWGIRRYQNEDGSLTPAGEKRYSTKEAREATRNELLRRSAEAYEQSAYGKAYAKYKKAHPDSDDEEFDDYLIDTGKYDRLHSSTAQSESLLNDAKTLERGYIGKTTYTAAVAGVLGGVVASAVTKKITGSGKMAVGAALGVLSGTVLKGNIGARQKRDSVMKKYEVDTNKSFVSKQTARSVANGGSGYNDKFRGAEY